LIFRSVSDEAAYTWMVSEALTAVLPYRPESIVAQTSCPRVRAALRRNRFLARGSFPVLFWSRGTARPAEPLLLINNASDAPLLPYGEGEGWPHSIG